MIDIDPPDEASRRLWHAVGDLAESLPKDWTLVGGLMVQLHALEHDVPDVRVTVDIDVLGQARPPGPLQAIDRALIDAGFDAQRRIPTTTPTGTSAMGSSSTCSRRTASARRRPWTARGTRSASRAARRR